MNDTIAAIATSIGESGIGIVRLSGKKAISIADKIFISKDRKKPSDFKTHTVHYGWIKEGSNVIDEVLLTVMRAPKSFTKEDVVEINCHGGIVAMRRALDLALKNGARLALPGEFTKRAFLNGRIDLAQAEAVLDIIKAKTDSALKISLHQLQGGLSCRINKIRKNILDILVNLEAAIDFPEEHINTFNQKTFSGKFDAVIKQLDEILSSSGNGKILREGIHIAICGRPNVGKSSLLNALLERDRSIVTHLAGTTRDAIEEVIDIKGIPVKIVDTAGISSAVGLIEKKAMQRTKQHMELADLILLVFDASGKLSKEDEILIKRFKDKTVLAVINKIDLKRSLEKEKISGIFNSVVEISAKKSKNIGLLKEAIVDLVYTGRVKNPEFLTVSNLRHINALKKSKEFVNKALCSLNAGLSAEFVAEDVKAALSEVDEILGRKFSEDLLDKIFSEFCIGK